MSTKHKMILANDPQIHQFVSTMNIDFYLHVQNNTVVLIQIFCSGDFISFAQLEDTTYNLVKN